MVTPDLSVVDLATQRSLSRPWRAWLTSGLTSGAAPAASEPEIMNKMLNHDFALSSGLATQYIQDENGKFVWEQCELTVHIDQFHQNS